MDDAAIHRVSGEVGGNCGLLPCSFLSSPFNLHSLTQSRSPRASPWRWQKKKAEQGKGEFHPRIDHYWSVNSLRIFLASLSLISRCRGTGCDIPLSGL